MIDMVWCQLRGKDVPEAECATGCPAPEARVVCQMEGVQRALKRASSEYGLTPRQYDYFRLRALGMTRSAIASRWGVAQSTVSNIAIEAHARLGVQSAIDAFRQLGWLTVPAVSPVDVNQAASLEGRAQMVGD